MIPSWSHRFGLLVPDPWSAPSNPRKTHIPIRLREKQRWTRWIHTLPTFKNTNGDTKSKHETPQMDTKNGIRNKDGGWNWSCRLESHRSAWGKKKQKDTLSLNSFLLTLWIFLFIFCPQNFSFSPALTVVLPFLSISSYLLSSPFLDSTNMGRTITSPAASPISFQKKFSLFSVYFL